MFACRTHCGQNGLARALWAGAAAPAHCRRSSVACPHAKEHIYLHQERLYEPTSHQHRRPQTDCRVPTVASSEQEWPWLCFSQAWSNGLRESRRCSRGAVESQQAA